MNTQRTEPLHTLLLLYEKVGEYDIFPEMLFGVIGVLLGWFFVSRIKKPNTKNEINFSIAFSMCISGTLIIFKEIIEFFTDFFTGTNLLKADFVDDNHWFYRIFGLGMSPYEQRPLFDTDEDMLLSLLSTLITTAFLYVYVRLKNKSIYIKNKARNRKSSGSVKDRIKTKIRLEKEKLSRDCSVADILFWWCTRALMLYAFFVMEVRAEANLLLANFVATFAVTLVHIVFPSESFFSKISYRTQSLITVIVFLGSYCGNYVMVYNIVSRFDLFLHFISGTLCVLGGYYIALTLVKSDSRKNIMLICLFSFCFSCFIMPAWEISEFIGDFIWGTSNQGFYWGPSDNSFFFTLFGRGAFNTELYPLYDTFYDVLLAFSTTLPSAVILFIFLTFKAKKAVTVNEVSDKKTPVMC